MLRTALSVLLAVAILGLVLPVADDARVAHSDSQVHSELETLEQAASDLRAASDPTAPHVDGAHVEQTIVLPGPAWGKAGIEWLKIPDRADAGVRWRVDGGTTQRLRPAPPLVAPGGLTLRESGRHRLRLELQNRDGEVVVVVTRADR